jgi:hypothetical protein
MPNQVQSWVLRTVVPLIVGLIIAYALKLGLHLTSPSVTVWVTSAVTAGYIALARYVEVKWPAIGKYLVSLGLVTAQPTYVTASVPAPAGPRAFSAENQINPATPKGEFPDDKPHELA